MLLTSVGGETFGFPNMLTVDVKERKSISNRITKFIIEKMKPMEARDMKNRLIPRSKSAISLYGSYGASQLEYDTTTTVNLRESPGRL